MKTENYDIDTSQLCHALGISRRALVYRMKLRGVHAAVRIGRRWYFSPAVFASPLALPG